MSKTYRTRLSKQHQEALEMFQRKVPVGSESDPSQFHLDDVKDEPKDEQPAPQDEPPVEQDETPTEPVAEPQDEKATESDDDWVDTLTYPEEVQTTEQQEQAQDLPSTEQHENESDEDYIARMRSEFQSLEHLDPDIADEFFDKAVAPFVKHMTERNRQEIEQLRQEVSSVKQNTTELQAERTARHYLDINAPIEAKHPKAKQILRSNEFVAFVNKDSNPYASETNYEVLTRAYRSGDVDYVIRTLDSFVESRKKPKPQVSADGSGSTSTTRSSKPKPMTEQEFLDLRKKVMANPRKYPKGYLRQLEISFFNQR